jgi:hypothetical protein
MSKFSPVLFLTEFYCFVFNVLFIFMKFIFFWFVLLSIFFVIFFNFTLLEGKCSARSEIVVCVGKSFQSFLEELFLFRIYERKFQSVMVK